MTPRARALVLLAVVAALAASLVGAAPSAAAGTTLYVDGKRGSDASNGTSAASAVKTIAEAASRIPRGTSAAGWRVIVQGYKDYTYRERPIPTDFAAAGTSAAPVVFQAAGYVPGSSPSYVRPIVSGADVAPGSGQRWASSGRAGVWKTTWTTEPYWYGRLKGTLRTALFQNGTRWLWEQPSLDALAARAARGHGGFWWDRSARELYVSAIGAPGAATNPANYRIEVITRPAFYFKGTQGVRYVQVRGFDVRHSANGIAFAKGVDYGVAADNRLVGNFLMGLQTSGAQTPNGPDPAVGNNLSRNTGAWNTFQLIKIDEGTQNATVCDNAALDNAFRGILVQGPPGGTGYTGTTSGILLCRNRLYSHDYNPTQSAYNNAAGVTIANGARNVTLDSNEIWGNDVGIHLTQESAGRQLLDGITIRYNQVWSNRRFGLNLYDGAFGNGSGKVTVFRDLYWDNGIGIMVSRGSTNNSIGKATVHGNRGDGIRVGESGQAKASASIASSLLTGNKGYGVWLVTGNSASLSYSGLPGNALGSIKGSPSRSAVNTQAPGYLSTTAGTGTYLKISTSSYQYRAGPSGTPIGARY